MTYESIRHIYVLNHALYILNSRFGVSVKDRHVPYLFICMRIHGTKRDILSTYSIGAHFRKCHRELQPDAIMSNMNYLSDEGFFVRVEKISKNDRLYYVYEITPFLYEYLGLLERQLRKIQWQLQ